MKNKNPTSFQKTKLWGDLTHPPFPTHKVAAVVFCLFASVSFSHRPRCLDPVPILFTSLISIV